MDDLQIIYLVYHWGEEMQTIIISLNSLYHYHGLIEALIKHNKTPKGF